MQKLWEDRPLSRPEQPLHWAVKSRPVPSGRAFSRARWSESQNIRGSGVCVVLVKMESVDYFFKNFGWERKNKERKSKLRSGAEQEGVDLGL